MAFLRTMQKLVSFFFSSSSLSYGDPHLFNSLDWVLTPVRATASYSFNDDFTLCCRPRGRVSTMGVARVLLSKFGRVRINLSIYTPSSGIQTGASTERLLEFDGCSNPLGHHGWFNTNLKKLKIIINSVLHPFARVIEH